MKRNIHSNGHGEKKNIHAFAWKFYLAAAVIYPNRANWNTRSLEGKKTSVSVIIAAVFIFNI